MTSKSRKIKSLVLAFLSIIMLISGILVSKPTEAATKVEKWIFCWNDIGREFLNVKETEVLPYMFNSKSAFTISENANDNVYNNILKVSGFNFFSNENKETKLNPFDVFGMAGLRYSSYGGEWKYFKIDACNADNIKVVPDSDYGKYYQNRIEPSTSFGERKTTKDLRTLHYNDVNRFWVAWKDVFNNLILSLNKFIITMIVSLITLSLSDVVSMFGMLDVAKIIFDNLFSAVFLPLSILVFAFTGIYLIYTGFIKKQQRQALSGVAKALLAFVFMVIMSNNPQFIALPNMLASTGQAVIIDSLNYGSKTEDMTLCATESGTQKLDNLRNPYEYMEGITENMSSNVGCRLWEEFLFKPWTKGQFGVDDWKELDSIENENGEWVGQPQVQLGGKTVENWALFQLSTQTNQHVSLDGYNSPFINNVEKDWWRVVDAMSNVRFKEKEVEGKSSSNSSSSSDPSNFTPNAEQKETAQKVYSAFKSLGMSDIQIAGALGNITQESQMKPQMVEGIYSGKLFTGDISVYTQQELFSMYDKEGISYSPTGYVSAADGKYYAGVGLVQWTGDRTRNLINFAQSIGSNWYTVETQLKYLLTSSSQGGESSYTERYARNDYSSVAEATEGWLDIVEGGLGMSTAHLDRRVKYADIWYKELGNFTVDEDFANNLINNPGVNRDSIGKQSYSQKGTFFKAKLMEPLEPKPTKYWTSWTGMKANRFWPMLLTTLLSSLAAVPLIAISMASIGFSFTLVLLMSISPFVFLLACFPPYEHMLKDWGATLGNTVLKKIFVAFLLVITIQFIFISMSMFNEIGVALGCILFGVTCYILFKNKDRLLNKISVFKGASGFFQNAVNNTTQNVQRMQNFGKSTLGDISSYAAARTYGSIKARQMGLSKEEAHEASKKAGKHVFKNRMYRKSGEFATSMRQGMENTAQKKQDIKEGDFTCTVCYQNIQNNESYYTDINNNIYCMQCGDELYDMELFEHSRSDEEFGDEDLVTPEFSKEQRNSSGEISIPQEAIEKGEIRYTTLYSTNEEFYESTKITNDGRITYYSYNELMKEDLEFVRDQFQAMKNLDKPIKVYNLNVPQHLRKYVTEEDRDEFAKYADVNDYDKMFELYKNIWERDFKEQDNSLSETQNRHHMLSNKTGYEDNVIKDNMEQLNILSEKRDNIQKYIKEKESELEKINDIAQYEEYRKDVNSLKEQLKDVNAKYDNMINYNTNVINKYTSGIDDLYTTLNDINLEEPNRAGDNDNEQEKE